MSQLPLILDLAQLCIGTLYTSSQCKLIVNAQLEQFTLTYNLRIDDKSSHDFTFQDIKEIRYARNFLPTIDGDADKLCLLIMQITPWQMISS